MSYSAVLDKVAKNLVDEESRDWFDARLKFSFSRDPFDFYPTYISIPKTVLGAGI